ncbi:MraY family glycosyltransferase [Patescibacteria group bacterium]
MGYYVFFTQRIIFSDSSILLKHIIGIFIGGSILIIGGVLDDKYNLKPSRQIIFPILATIIVIISGLGIKYITNPFGGIIQLDIYKLILFKFKGIPYMISLPSDIITFFWILGMIYTTKLLDGLDGLTTGITIIGAIVIFLASFSKFYVVPQVALMSIILAGACIGFLFFNFNPAKIFLGEGGSTLCGFLLASLAILSQGKIAVTLLVMGIPLLDVVWVIFRRFWNSGMVLKADRKHQIVSPLNKGGLRGVLKADRKHLHHRLLDIGFSHRGAVIFLYCIIGVFGITSLFLQSRGRGMALVGLILFMAILGMWVVRRYQRNNFKF